MQISTSDQFKRNYAHRVTVDKINKDGVEQIEISDKEPLVIYQNKQKKTEAQTLIIFVHGLGGNRFNTWLSFPEFLQEEIPYLDVGMYQYATATSRIFRATPNIQDQAQTLAHIIRNENEYRRIILIGHSLGGIMHMGAIEYLLRTEEEALDNIKALFLMATPQLGSARVPWLSRVLSKDARALYPYNAYLNNIHEAFANHINPFAKRTMTKSGKPMRQIPIFVVTADRDVLVDKLSAGSWIPTRQKNHSRGSHTSIVKPKRKSSDAYRWVRNRILECFPDLAAEYEKEAHKKSQFRVVD